MKHNADAMIADWLKSGAILHNETEREAQIKAKPAICGSGEMSNNGYPKEMEAIIISAKGLPFTPHFEYPHIERPKSSM